MEYTKHQLALIEQHREHATDYQWWDSTMEDFIAVAKAFGISVDMDNIHFSGFWSQGDGASFETNTFSLSDILDAGLATVQGGEYGKDPEEFEGYVREFYLLYWMVFQKIGHHALLHPEGRQVAESFKHRIYRNGPYSHEHTMRIQNEDYYDWSCTDSSGAMGHCPGLDLDNFDGELLTYLRDCAKELYATLESEYEHLTSDDAVWDMIVANEWNKEDEDEQAEAA